MATMVRNVSAQYPGMQGSHLPTTVRTASAPCSSLPSTQVHTLLPANSQGAPHRLPEPSAAAAAAATAAHLRAQRAGSPQGSAVINAVPKPPMRTPWSDNGHGAAASAAIAAAAAAAAAAASTPDKQQVRANASLRPPTGTLVAQDLVDHNSCIQSDCATCQDTRRRGFVNCRLPCGHIVRAQIVDFSPENCAYSGVGVDIGPQSHGRSESPSMFTAHRDREQAGTSPPPRSIIRQTSGVRNPVPSVGIPAPVSGSHGQISAPLSPQRGSGSPSSPQHTPGTMYRKAPSSLTSFTIARESHGQQMHQVEQHTQQMTSRSSTDGGGGGGGGQSINGPNIGNYGGVAPRSTSKNTADKPHKWGTDFGYRADAPPDCRQARRPSLDAPGSTASQIVTDNRGDVLHRMCNVILLSPQQGIPEREQQLKVRGQIIGTFWDERDIGPRLENSSEVQVMVTYVDATERHVPLLFPTKYAQTFGETETAEGNIIKWKAALCKVGKKFA